MSNHDFWPRRRTTMLALAIAAAVVIVTVAVDIALLSVLSYRPPPQPQPLDILDMQDLATPVDSHDIVREHDYLVYKDGRVARVTPGDNHAGQTVQALGCNVYRVVTSTTQP